jgi:hypothetical protein
MRKILLTVTSLESEYVMSQKRRRISCVAVKSRKSGKKYMSIDEVPRKS